MPSTTTITVSQLARLVGTPDCPALIDVCTEEDFEADPRLIPTAFRHPFTDIETVAPALSGRRVVVVCQKGLKLSEGAAALLRLHGVRAEHLEGGMVGWRSAGQLLLAVEKIPVPPSGKGSLWVTRHRPKIDRIACPWLIRRFIDRDARFLFVSPGEVMTVADRFGATPLDAEGAALSHRGEECTFDALLAEFSLASDPLQHLATIVRAADTGRFELAPQAAGLTAVALGMSRMYKDDLAQLDAGMMIYDALYRWCRDAVDERHYGPGHQGRV